MKRLAIFLILCSAVFAQSNIDEDSIHFVGQASAFTVGADLVTNGTFDPGDWTADDPDDWSVTEAGDATSNITENPAGECQIISDGVNAGINQVLLTVGKTYRLTFDVTAASLGSIKIRTSGATADFGTYSAVGTHTAYSVALTTQLGIFRNTACDITIDNVEVVEWPGDPDAGGGCTIASFTGDLLDYMTATGGVLHTNSGLALADVGGNLEINAGGGGWDTTPQVGTFVKCDFDKEFTDGIYKIIAANGSTIIIDLSSAGLTDATVEVWIGGAYPDIATALNDSTLSRGSVPSIYRKRYICVNVPQKVDEVTDFVAENSETTLREDDGSRKLIGFYDSFSVVSLKAGTYNVVSDCDFGGTYYGGALAAFQFDEGFTQSETGGIVIDDLVTNGDFADWTADDPDDWNVTEVGDATSNVTENPAGQCQMISDGTNVFIAQGILTIGKTYRVAYDVISHPTGDFRVANGGTTVQDLTVGSVGSQSAIFTATATTINFKRKAGALDITIDNVSVTEVVTPGWIEIDAQGNDINILELNTSNFEMRNFKLHNTAIGGTNALLHVDDASVFNHAFANCWFGTADLLTVDDFKFDDSVIKDCYFSDSVVSKSLTDVVGSWMIGCIGNGDGRGYVFDGFSQPANITIDTLFYKGARGTRMFSGEAYINCIFMDQTTSCLQLVSNDSRGIVINSILSPATTSDNAIEITTGGSLSPASYNNIMYSVTGGGVLTTPISHDQITPNPPLPAGTLQVDPLFVNPADGDFRLQAASPARNTGIEDIFSGKSTIGIWQPIGGGYGPGIGSGIGR